MAAASIQVITACMWIITRPSRWSVNGAPLLRTQAGWRLDRSLAEGSFTFQGNFRDNDFGSTNDPDLRDLALTSQVGNVLANWQKDFGAGQIDLRSYYSWTHRGAPGKWDDSATGLDAQFNIERIGRHLITSGLGYRYATDEMKAPSAAHSQLQAGNLSAPVERLCAR